MSINLILNEDGILERSKQAKKEYENSQQEEQEKLNLISDKLENMDNILIKILIMCGINKEYEIEDVMQNKDDVLKIIFENKSGSEKLLQHNIKDIANSQKAMQILGESIYAKYLVVMNDNYMQQIRKSDYAQEFDKESVKVPIGTTTNIIVSEGYYSELYLADKAFDNWDNDTWYNSKNDSQVPKYIGYDFQKDVIIYKVECNIRVDNLYNNISLQGGRNTEDWKEISKLSMEGFENNRVTKTYDINSKEPFTKFRFYASDPSQLSNRGGLTFQILQFYCVEVPENV